MDETVGFSRLVHALRPWLDQLVVVGGWAHRLYWLHEKAHPRAYAAVRTKDADIAISTNPTLSGDIAEALRNAGFHEGFFGEDMPPITHYELGDQDGGFYAEFLAPLSGSGHKRNGAPDVTVSTAGVTAQKLRHVDLLMVEPWSVDLGPATSPLVATATSVMIVNPVTFIAQKLLIAATRSPQKQAQDVLYIYDTLDLFGPELGTLQALWRGTIKPALALKTARQVKSLSAQRFDEVTDVIREAALIPQDRRVAPERIQQACAHGLAMVFG